MDEEGRFAAAYAAAVQRFKAELQKDAAWELDMSRLNAVLQQAQTLFAQISAMLPSPPEPVDWGAVAFRWRVVQGRGHLQAIRSPHEVSLDALAGLERHKQTIVRNTAAFVAGRPANHVLLTGARGTGKSSLIKAMLPMFKDAGLRMIEVDRNNLSDLPEIMAAIAHRPERFIIFCDDLSFEQQDISYKALKTALDGSLFDCKVLIYASSNRRHLMPETMRDNLEQHHDDDGEIRPGETLDEKIALAERFGICLNFYPFDQNEYLAAVALALAKFDLKMSAGAERAALLWSHMRGARSGRVAWQFAKDWAGRLPEERGQF